MSDPFSTVLGNLERLAAEGKITRPPGGFTGKIRPQIRNTSRPLKPLESVPVRALVAFTNDDYRDKNSRGPKNFKPGDTVYLQRHVNGFLHIMPFQIAGQGFEMCKDAVEGKHYEFI